MIGVCLEDILVTNIDHLPSLLVTGQNKKINYTRNLDTYLENKTIDVTKLKTADSGVLISTGTGVVLSKNINRYIDDNAIELPKLKTAELGMLISTGNEVSTQKDINKYIDDNTIELPKLKTMGKIN